MDAYESRLASVAKKAIEELMDDRKGSVLNGHSRTYDDYRYSIGYLHGLALGLKALEEARQTLMAGERV